MISGVQHFAPDVAIFGHFSQVFKKCPAFWTKIPIF